MDDLYRDAAADDGASSAFMFDHHALERALKHIYERDFRPMTEIEENLFHETLHAFNEACETGIRQSGVELQPEFRRKLEQGNALFSAFKVHRMQNDIAAQLYDSNGVLKPFEQWKNDVHPMLDHHVRHWLRTEYDTAVIRARQAADWQRFRQYADILPNLEWMPSTSAHPGADHKTFWGTILPIDHPFWSAHRPGDRWNCKCNLSATDEPPTRIPQANDDPKNRPAPGLDNNPGVDGKLFGDSHPYIKNAYPGAKEAVKEFLKKVDERKEEKAERKKKKQEEKETFATVPTKHGKVRVSSKHGKGERQENIRVASYFANKHGQEIDLLENKDGEKSADCYNRTLKVEQEYKVNSKATASAIDNALRKAARQAEDVVLWIESDISWEDLNAAIRPRIRRSGITHITIVKDGKDRRYSREEILSDNFKIRPADLK